MAEKRKKKEEEKLGWQKSVLLYAHDMLYLLLIVMLLFLLVFRIIVVSGGSMRMTLLDGDYLLLLNNTFYHTPQRGDIVVISKESFDNGKPIVNSADAGSRISNIDLAAANDAIVIALCSADGIAKDNEERMMHCHHMLERGLSLGMDASDLWFDPLFLVVKGMQDKQMDVLNAIKLFADEGLKSTGGLSNNSNGAPKAVRPILDATLVAMAMMQGLTSAIVNPNDLRLMETIKSCDIFKNHVLYSDSYLDE